MNLVLFYKLFHSYYLYLDAIRKWTYPYFTHTFVLNFLTYLLSFTCNYSFNLTSELTQGSYLETYLRVGKHVFHHSLNSYLTSTPMYVLSLLPCNCIYLTLIQTHIPNIYSSYTFIIILKILSLKIKLNWFLKNSFKTKCL